MDFSKFEVSVESFTVLGETVYLKQLTGKQITEYQKKVQAKDAARAFSELISMSLCDVDGVLLLTTIEQKESIQNWNMKALMAFGEVINKFNGLGEDAKEEAEKN